MESIQSLKRRLKGVSNISQITKAMELVAATKMRKSQEIALSSRPYAFVALDLLANLTQLSEVKNLPPILKKRQVKKTAYVVITSDKGLAGSFNSAVFREFEKFVQKEKIDLQDPKYVYLAIGQKAVNFLKKKNLKIHQEYVKFGDFTEIEEVRPLSDLLVSGYLKKEWDEVLVFSTHFKSALSQKVYVRKILPINFKNLKKDIQEIIPQTGRYAEMGRELQSFVLEKPEEYAIEPSAEMVLGKLVPHLVEMQIYHLILEANASEHAARRMAMKNASDNAGDLSSGLTLTYNKARQGSITREIVEVTAGAESLNK